MKIVSAPGTTGEPNQCYPWTNVYGLARTVLAIGTLLTLMLHPASVLFTFSTQSSPQLARLVPFTRLGFFQLFAPAYLEWARWFAIAGLALVATGWRPRVTGLLHWYISVSFTVSCLLIDGGDQITSVLTTLLLPATMTDPRRWHWQTESSSLAQPSLLRKLAGLIASSTFLVIRLQVAIIYFHSAVGKFGTAEWANGTAVYYWFNHPIFGLGGWMKRLAWPVLANPVAVTALTWGVILFELLLSMALVIEKRWRSYLLVAGIIFHLAIVFVHGLASFFFAVTGALILFLRPMEKPFQLSGLRLFYARRELSTSQSDSQVPIVA